MQGFSLIDKQINHLQREREYQSALAPASPWADRQRTPAARKRRMEKARNSFAFFDSTYFPPEVYRQGYKKPGQFLKALDAILDTPGVQVVLGARKHGKTVTAKKKLVWRLLTGRTRLAGTMSQVLDVSQLMLDDLYKLLQMPRVMEDWGVEWIVANQDLIEFRVRPAEGKPHSCKAKAFSEDRSVRGYSELFERPDYILCDDLQTRTSSLTTHRAAKLRAFLNETKSSLVNGATVVVLGNNFDERTIYNQLLTEQQEGTLASDWAVHLFPAWSNHGPLWPEAYPAQSEQELMGMVESATMDEWLGDYQQTPREPDGEVFREEHWTTYDELPADCRKAVIYADQNLSLKSKGDTTGIPTVGYSPSEGAYYVIGPAVCRSYSDPIALLDDALSLRTTKVVMIGFDGHVSQESTWSAFIRMWCKEKNRPYPPHSFHRFVVDNLSTGVQALWAKGLIRFPKGFATTEDGKRARTQLITFTGKKAARKDDYPDALICAIELLGQLHIATPAGKRERHAHATFINDAIGW